MSLLGLRIDEAKKFLEALALSGDDRLFTFQTFDDNESRKKPERRKGLNRIFHGRFEDNVGLLERMNRDGAGVFAMINRGDGLGRKASNVLAPRSLFADQDSGHLPQLKLEPSAVIDSNRGAHVYYFLKAGEDLARIESAQRTLAFHLGTDPSVADRPRVMRLPGFLHLKDPAQPYLVKIRQLSGHRYSIEEILAAYPIPPSGKRFERSRACGNLDQFLSWVDNLPTAASADNPVGGRNNTAVLLVREGLGRGLREEDMERALDRYCEASGLEQSEAHEILRRHLLEHAETPFKSFFGIEKKELPAIDLAESYLTARKLRTPTGLSLRYYQADFVRHNGTRYSKVPLFDLKADVTSFIQSQPLTRKRAGTRLTNEIVANLQGLTLLPGSTEVPSYLGSTVEKTGPIIPLKNGLLLLDRIINDQPQKLLPHSPDYFSLQCLPYAYDPHAVCPRWLEFLDAMVPNFEMRQLIQEWIGYNLIPDTRLQKFVIFFGQGANGKTVILTVLRALLGFENVSSVALEQLNPQRTFPLIAMIGKLANVVEEIGETDSAAEGVLKNLVDGRVLSVERKGIDPFEARFTARLTFATNVLPRFRDKTDGLWRRVIVIPMTEQILEPNRQDKRLADMAWWEQSGELPGILNWALEGLKRLLQRGSLQEPSECLEAKSQYRRDNNPALVFLFDHCRQEGGAKIAANQLYRTYHHWAKDRGQHPLAETQFAHEVKRAFSLAVLTENARRQADGSRTREWHGLGWIDSASMSGGAALC